MKPMIGIVPDDREDQATARRDNDGEIVEDHGESRFSAFGIP